MHRNIGLETLTSAGISGPFTSMIENKQSAQNMHTALSGAPTFPVPCGYVLDDHSISQQEEQNLAQDPGLHPYKRYLEREHNVSHKNSVN
jgi:hypothetical protein